MQDTNHCKTSIANFSVDELEHTNGIEQTVNAPREIYMQPTINLT